MTGIERFDAAVTSFERALESIGTIHIHLAAPDIAVARLEHQVAAGGSRILGAADVLREVHESAIAAGNTSHEARNQPGWEAAYREQLRHIGRLGACYQAMFMFVRSYHDSLCRVLLRRAGHGWGAKASMARALTITEIEEEDVDRHLQRTRRAAVFSATHPAAIALSAPLPDFPKWFVRWRDLRNVMKTGASISFFGTGEDLGLIVNEIRPSGSTFGDTREVINLATIAEGLEMSARVSEVAATAAAVQPGVAADGAAPRR